ncbi:MAG: type II toxin-antitoxin system HicA family toxin [Bryobacterales bacterium]|nr:type II toxin-antitoxin system HicA family toxin [Bryobacterales bacterium]
MKPISGPDLCRLLEAAGWKLQRTSGSHRIYTKTGERKVLAVPVHGNRNLKPGLARSLARDANLRW